MLSLTNDQNKKLQYFVENYGKAIKPIDPKMEKEYNEWWKDNFRDKHISGDGDTCMCGEVPHPSYKKIMWETISKNNSKNLKISEAIALLAEVGIEIKISKDDMERVTGMKFLDGDNFF